MKEPDFTQHPTEIFGYAFTDLSSEAQTARNNQFCPFLDGECRKLRKSEPEVKVGVCTNEFLKTMMQQVYKKGMVVEHWNKKIVFVIQDVGLDYIQSSTDAGDLRDATDEDAIHFCTFRTVWDESLNAWQLEFSRRVSTNTEGVRKMLGGAHEDRFPTITEFQNRIRARLSNAQVQLRSL